MVCRVVCVRGFPPVALPLVAFLHWLPAFRSLARHVRRARDEPLFPRSGSGVTAAPDPAAPRSRAPGGVTWSRSASRSWTSDFKHAFHCTTFGDGAGRAHNALDERPDPAPPPHLLRRDVRRATSAGQWQLPQSSQPRAAFEVALQRCAARAHIECAAHALAAHPARAGCAAHRLSRPVRLRGAVSPLAGATTWLPAFAARPVVRAARR